MKRLFATVAVLVTLIGITPYSTKAQDMVSDQSFSDPGFLAFKLKLTEAVIERDTSKLFNLLATNITTNDHNCNYSNNACFKDLFRIGNPATVSTWDEMYQIISLGFSKNVAKKKDFFWRVYKGDVVFQAPAYFKHIEDENKQLIVLAKNVNIRQKPTTKSKSIGLASYERLKYNSPYTSNSPTAYNNIDGKLWFEVILYNGKMGYIHQDFVSATIKRELSVKKVYGQWKIISFYEPTPDC